MPPGVRAGHGEPCAYEECPLCENGACALEKLTADGEPDEDWPDWANTTVVARGLLERDLAP